MKETKNITGLGVFSQEKKVFLIDQNFNIDSSNNGFDFIPYAKFSIKSKNGRDFRISQVGNNFFLTFIYQPRKQSFLAGAFSSDLKNWQYIGKIPNVKEAGMLVPDYKYQNKYCLFYFEQSLLKIATSYDLKTWQIVKKPIMQVTGNQLTIANIILTKAGILVIFYTKGYSLAALLFDKKDPTKPLWRQPQTIWQQNEFFQQSIYPFGVVELDGNIISYWNLENEGILAITHLTLAQILTLGKVLPSFHLNKSVKNPIIEPIADHNWESKATFNPAALYENGKIHLIYRAIGDNDISVLGYAQSEDGIHISLRLPNPIFNPNQPPRLPFTNIPYMSGGGWGGCEDPRLTKIENRIYLTYVAFDGWGPPRVALTSIDAQDFNSQRWNWDEPKLISPPGVVDKNACLLSEKIDGKFVVFHRIFPNILVDFVDDLNFENSYLKGQFSIKPRKTFWDSRKIGAGPPPLKTKDGWLLIYHAVGETDPGRYKIGAMLLDPDNPVKVLARSNQPILEPNLWYENEGYKSGVAYPCGAAVVAQKLLVYYGGADKVVCVAGAHLNTFLDQLKYCQSPQIQKINV